MTQIRRRPALSALGVVLVLLASARGATATTFTVTTLADAGAGSLRQAVLQANAAAGPDEIAFAAGLTGTITLTSGEIAISDPLIVHGPGASLLTVSGNDQFRIFFVESLPALEPIAVTLSGLTLTRGRGFPEHTFAFGGAVFSNGENLTILDCVISDSQTGFQMDPPNDGCGGNVALYGANGGTLRIENSLLTGGKAVGFGSESGGNLCVLSGTLTLERSTLSGGSAASGGGLYLVSPAGDSSIHLSTLTGNHADTSGGGVHFEPIGATGALTLESSTISGNATSTSGSGGGLAMLRGEVRISGSTITANEAGVGGAIYDSDGDLQLVNSTVSGNHAGFRGGGILFFENGAGSMLLRLTTVSNNSANQSAGSILISSPSAAGVVQLDHSIVANGAPEDLAGFGAVPATLTANHSLIEAPGTTVLVGANNRIGVDPLLSPLSNHGGPTLTHALLSGSPALDAGDPMISSPPATDQRGAPRIAGPAIDLGAVEGGQGLAEVPALSQLGLLVLGALILAAGLRRLRVARATTSST